MMSKDTATGLVDSGKMNLDQLIEIGKRAEDEEVWSKIIRIILSDFQEELFADGGKCRSLRKLIIDSCPNHLALFEVRHRKLE